MAKAGGSKSGSKGDSKSGSKGGARDQSASGKVAQDVVRGIYEGCYVAGQRLVEPDLAERYGVSRSSVREAIKQMAADGIVSLSPFRGAQIRRLSRAEAANIFSITEVILGLAARQAAAHIEEGDARDRLQRAFDAVKAQAGSGDNYAFIRERNRYFRTLVEINHNDELWRILPKLQAHLVRNRQAVATEDRIKGYRNITEAILVGDQEAAEAAARAYVRATAAKALPNFPE